jgi:3-oxoacyl-[acyl-carrier-protein] synthase-3
MSTMRPKFRRLYWRPAKVEQDGFAHMSRSVIRSVGAYLPQRVLTNAELSTMVDTSDEWIQERTGIRQRHIAAEGEYTSHLAIKAAQAALDNAGMAATDIDLIVLATSTPDQTFPATAATVQAELGITQGAAFDVQAVCSGFVYALTTADNFIKAGSAQNVLVIGAETFSRILDWEDRGTCVLFGDGAGAVVVTAAGAGDAPGRGIMATRLRSDGRFRDKLYVDGGPSTTQTTGHLRMEGREVFKHAVTNISDVMGETLAQAGVSASDIDLFVPHQANKRILDGTARKFGIASEKVVVTVGEHGNTSAASIPLALDVAFRDGRLYDGSLVLMEAMGGGFTWGAVLARW